MHVFPMASVESTVGLAAQESWKRGSRWHCAGPSHAWSKHYWQDEYVISLISIIFSIFSHFDLAKTIEIDALRFQNKELNVVGTLEYGQFGVVRLFAISPVCYLLKIR
jgi:hypothetical protein